MSDVLERFLFDDAPTRGGMVRLQDSYAEVLHRHDYPPVLQRILGEMMAASALLASSLKFDGALLLQLHGKGDLKLAVVEWNADHTLRATARWEGDLADDASLNALLGAGMFVLILDPKNGTAPYQGMVALEGESIAEMLEHYMRRSEQLDTRLWLAADGRTASGLLLQKLPDGHGDADAWPRAVALADTVRSEELLGLEPAVLLHRLFHEEPLRCFEPTAVSFACSCSRERVGNMLVMVGAEEVKSILQEQGSVNIDCEYCRQNYVFDEADARELFTKAGAVLVTPSTRH